VSAKIRKAQEGDLQAWVALRRALWPGHAEDALLEEARAILASPDEVCFLLVGPEARAVGFAEAAVHIGPKGPYGHVEGWYVMPEFRGRGHGRALVQRVENWCLHRAICLLTSDTDPAYPLSPDAHARAGFRKLLELTIFIKELEQPLERDE
jgi:aminoglycoside 6'-N-acetyltransferase I